MGRKKLPEDKKKKRVNVRISPYVLEQLREKGLKQGPEFERCVIKVHKLKEPKQ